MQPKKAILTTHQKRRIAGTMWINIRIPQSTHDAIKAIARAQREEQGEPVAICTVYREAIYQFVKNPRQKRLLRLLKSA